LPARWRRVSTTAKSRSARIPTPIRTGMIEMEVDGQVQPATEKERAGFGASQPYDRPSMRPKTMPPSPSVIRMKPGRSKPSLVFSSRDSPMYLSVPRIARIPIGRLM
jgi:hypothetical protein